MANRSFSRGTQVYGASASMVFVGNTDSSVAYMLNHSDLFEALPKDYYDTAFLDRIHAYLPGWEVDKLRNEMFTDGYGFVVDYLAEILRELRKEDRMNEYAQHFELSDTITTRDKTGILKTYAGLCKVIFPNGDADIDELKEILEFAIESRRRVKLQLQKMDETFEAVDFSYRVIGEKDFKEVITLEEIQYLKKENIFIEEVAAKADQESEVKEKIIQKVLTSQHIEIMDNQRGVSYQNLFGDYFSGAKSIKIIDPFIRLPYQIRNLVELINVILNHKKSDEVIEVELITSNIEDFIDQSKEQFFELSDNLKQSGINFSFQFDDSVHDREILIDDNWKIILGRGLDMWQKTNGYFDIAEINQLFRKCRRFSVTILGKGEF